jgi:hypothetical protein
MLEINVKTIDGQNRSYSVPDNVKYLFFSFFIKCHLKWIFVSNSLVYGQTVQRKSFSFFGKQFFAT